ncbi:hypothetical protein [Yellowstone lake phycodnavirus 3]|uniref:hypothetical protein n=1 Tax=Yellowstone lake phycodnavirus 3 TaxID=1586715 RepID=UPI0006EB7F91|nr:hypothetical protein AR677_gp168 [Yellowstone lake phycodnavirus 3]BAT22667.1 hypothetical protein [Yellowstone lake phycodnavirus 3]
MNRAPWYEARVASRPCRISSPFWTSLALMRNRWACISGLSASQAASALSQFSSGLNFLSKLLWIQAHIWRYAALERLPRSNVCSGSSKQSSYSIEFYNEIKSSGRARGGRTFPLRCPRPRRPKSLCSTSRRP